MNKQVSKKVNSKQKTVAVVALIVTILLAICVTFAWYTNRINVMNGKITLGSFDYTVTLYDVSGTTATEAQTATYDKQESDKWALSSSTVGVGSDSVKYQVVKVENNSGFGIKAYEYLTFNEMSAQETALANYFYFKPYKLNLTGDLSASQISSFLSNYSFPSASDIASPNGEVTFGTIKNNAVALEKNAVESEETSYYLLAYCVTGLPDEMTFADSLTVDINPILTIGQANGPIPQTTASSQVIYADSWQALRSAIAAANSGDTVFLTKDIEGPAATNLSITNGVNLNLNGYNMRIHGDLVFNYKTTDARKLTVPASSKLYVEGDMYINTLGAFSVNSTGSSQNIFLGKLENSEVSGGGFYVNAALSAKEPANAGPEDFTVDENSGFTLTNVQVKKMTTAGTYSAAADLTVTGSDTMVKITAGAVLNSITVPERRGINDVYIVNYGEIDSIDLANIDYNAKSLQVGAYVKNYNSVGSLSLKSGSAGAKGYTTDSALYNTRVINGDGAATAFSGDYNSPYFVETDIEPFGESTDESVVVQESLLDGIYTVYLKNTSANAGSNAESITALFNSYDYDYKDCRTLKIVTNNGITLKPAQFTNIRSNFERLEKLDLSSAAMYNHLIPANAMDATASGSKSGNLKELLLPVTTVEIGSSAFKGTKIEELTISSNISNIGQNAFAIDSQYTLEVIWDRSDDPNFLSAFDVNNTIIFMEESLAQAAMDLTYSDEWKMNMYEFYDFKAENGTYYCKYSVFII